MESKNKRGGAGRGQGRNPKPQEEKLVKRQVFLRTDQLEKMKGQNLSAVVRQLLDQFLTESG